MSTTLLDGTPDPDVLAAMSGYMEKTPALNGNIGSNREVGEPALRRLLLMIEMGNSDSDQTRWADAVLLNCHNGEAALRRLLPIATGNSGQSRQVAAVLLGCYNGARFPLDLTNLRSLDFPILEDALAVLRMEANALQKVHCYFERGGPIFEKLAEDWGFNQAEEA